ncbi:P-loop containing nucleoside triphosphate hydrolase protein [Jimgerdemannia flammicorona]|uniref:P-loop containing nucleoside triphosphate hydrolase protein n=1 Tax=Jimgerdemannia flammicorona TaxID=994334 RepID=A0A433CYB2_9FUNG|nr:P-loop containing nucleoside triphosphate hydrolase protein [Jimgerdemannia flammicorona]
MATDLILPYVHRKNIEDTLFNALNYSLSNDDDTQVVNLVGIAGMGKTRIAKQYYDAYSQQYSDIFWIDGTHNEIETYLKSKLKIPVRMDNCSANQTANDIRRSLSQLKKWLLVIDNVKDVNSFEQYIPRKCGHVIIIYRTQLELQHGIVVDKMTIDEALCLLWGSGPVTELAKYIVMELGCIPIIITHVRQHNMRVTTKRLLKYIQTHPNELNNISVWNSAIDKLGHENTLVMQILNILLHTLTEGIPPAFFGCHLELFTEQVTLSDIRTAINTLVETSLVKRIFYNEKSSNSGSGTLILHINPVIQRIMRRRILGHGSFTPHIDKMMTIMIAHPQVAVSSVRLFINHCQNTSPTFESIQLLGTAVAILL